jgi:predicted acetyltransferase
MLIDAIVRQTMVLIAQLATAGGGRAQLSHTANQVFLDLVAALKEQGLGNKVIADMFGMALRTYQTKVQRLSESRTDRGRSLWEALLAFVQERGTERAVSRAAILQRFRHDDALVVSGVLRDLVDSGLLYRTGRGDLTQYGVAPRLAHLRSIDDFDRRRIGRQHEVRLPKSDAAANGALRVRVLHHHVANVLMIKRQVDKNARRSDLDEAERRGRSVGAHRGAAKSHCDDKQPNSRCRTSADDREPA